MPDITYQISHSTVYNYESPVRVCHNLVMLTPRGDWAAQPLQHRVAVKPEPVVVNRREDYFGNQILAFSIEESHRQLTVAASGRITVHFNELPEGNKTPPWEQVLESVKLQTDPRWLESCQFRFSSPRIRTGRIFAEYAAASFPRSRPILAGAMELMQRIFKDFRYDTQATHVHTPTEEAFTLRRGVCQDFAHVQIACLRSLGLSARYVSGYLRTELKSGQTKLIGCDQSHAWVSLYCGQQFGWIDLDPTNNKACDGDHIPIAWGRDYSDVVPVRGVFLGGGKHQIKVNVDVNLAAV